MHISVLETRIFIFSSHLEPGISSGFHPLVFRINFVKFSACHVRFYYLNHMTNIKIIKNLTMNSILSIFLLHRM